MKDYSTKCYSNLKKFEKIVVYEFNNSFALIFREWKMVLSNLTVHREKYRRFKARKFIVN